VKGLKGKSPGARDGKPCPACGRLDCDGTCTKPDWTRKCEVCGATPVMPATGLCGPCTFGEAETVGGNW
jgi:hypothetical protein